MVTRYGNKILALVLLVTVVAFLYVDLGRREADAAWFDSSWDYRVAITIDADNVDADLTDFPVYVDLSDLPAHFWSNVKSDCGDIRITTSDEETEVPREIVSCDGGTDTGELHFKAPTISNTTDTTFYIYYGNASASDYADDATYGAENVWTNGYAGVWHLEEDPGGTAPQIVDSTGNGNDGTSEGEMGSDDLTEGQVAKALDFDGSDDYINVPNDTSLQVSGSELTLSAWYYHVDQVSRGRLVGKTQTNYVWGIGAYSGVTGVSWPSWRFELRSDNVVNTLTYTETSQAFDDAYANTWVHMVGSYDGSNMRMYLNAAEVTSTPKTGDINTTSDPLNIGARGGAAASDKFSGKVDEVRVSSVVRSQEWIAAEYANQNSPATFYSIGSEEAEPAPDTTPPTPDPMTFSSAPSADDEDSISMTASTATDADGSDPVEYYFTYTACGSNAGTGGTDSGWQESTTYTDTGLEAGKCYGYTVKARDAEGNETAASAAGEATTESEQEDVGTSTILQRVNGGVRLSGGIRLKGGRQASGGAPADTNPPTPDPMTFASDPSINTSANSISMTASTATDAEGSTPIQYYFTAVSHPDGFCGAKLAGLGDDSGWQTSTSYTDTGLNQNSCYGYQVKARDSEGNETSESEVIYGFTSSSGGPGGPG